MIKSESTVLIFTETLSPRLTYVLDFIFKSKGQAYTLVSDDQYSKSEVSIAYSNKNTPAKLNILPSHLLDEETIHNTWKLEFNDKKQEWTINGIQDNLAVIFYFLSRYEEYTDKTRDEYGRFTAAQSAMHQANQLHLPWCDILVKNIWETIGLNSKKLSEQYRTKLTYDIDIAWAYKFKPKWRTAANFIKSVANPKQFNERWKVIRNQIPDPYDSYHRIEENALKHPTTLFFLLGDYGQLDKNHHYKNKELRALVTASQKYAELGIHPSFGSFLNEKKVQQECKRLAEITSKPTKNSRQHFLRLSLPHSYHILLKAGISHDYSMGFAEHYGFRAGTSVSFPFYDLTENKTTALNIVPFTVMDGTLKEYMKLTPKQAIDIVRNLKKTIQSVGGQFTPIWHNHSIGNQKEWQGWQSVYDECVK